MWLALPFLASPAGADELGAVLDRAAQLEADGDPAAALEALLPFRAVAPEDYALALRIGWLASAVERWDLAAEEYGRAVALSGGSTDAVLGLAWARLRQGDRAGARALVEPLKDDPRAAELLAATAAPRPQGRGRLGGSFTSLPPGAGPSTATELRAGATGTIRSLSAGLDVAGTAYTGLSTAPGTAEAALRHGPPTDRGRPSDGGGPGPGSPPAAVGPRWQVPEAGPWADVDVWGRAGVDGERLGVDAVGAGLLRTAAAAQGFVAGGVARAHLPPVSPGIEVSWTSPRDDAPDVLRGALSVALALGPASLVPEGSAQRVDGTWLGAIGGTAWLVPRPFALWVGGRVGEQRYTTWLDLAVHSPWPVAERGSLWAGVRLGRLDRSWLSVGWTGTWLGLGAPAHTVTASWSPHGPP